MSRRCDLCGRGPKKIIRRSHSKRATIGRQYLNLQTKTIDGKKKKVCTKCIKTITKTGTTPARKKTTSRPARKKTTSKKSRKK